MTYCGYVALLGPPNAGKSTLLNALVGERLSSVTPKAQTTWKRIAGIRTNGDRQIVFLDTPGLFEARTLVHRSLVAEAEEAARDADLLVLVIDPTTPMESEGRELIAKLVKERARTTVGVVNKMDVSSKEATDREIAWLSNLATDGVFLLSASRNEGVQPLMERLESLIPEGPFLFPDDEIATAPVRFFVGELVRETIFEEYHQEIPYASFCEVEEYREETPRTYIRVVIYVEQASQKGILIGEGGRAIRELGTRARGKIESFLGEQVFLDLWVKVLPGWRKKEGELRRLGFTLAEEGERSRA
jgi:GTP-binding protein Era